MVPNAKTLSFELSSDPRQIPKVSEQLVELLLEFSVPSKFLFEIRLAVEEALINAMKHGNELDSQSKVLCSIKIDEKKLVITVEDQGEGFDHKGRSYDPEEKENFTKLSGRGVFLIESYMDKAEYNQKGNKLTMIKNFG